MTQDVMVGAEPAYQPGEAAGVLLLHDLAGTPQPLRSLADALCAEGFSVEVPLLPGHGTAITDLEEMTWDDWAGAAQLALDELASRAGPVVVGGIAMGATLACWVAANMPEVAGVVAINPRAMPVPAEAVATLEVLLRDGVRIVPPLGTDVSDRRIQVLSYDSVPIATLISMFGALDSMADHWDELKSPLLIVHSVRDHRVSPAHADWLAAHAGGAVERLVLERSFHEATVDVEHEELERATVDFVRRMTA